MPVCSNCSALNPDGARFCASCGTPLPTQGSQREVRKTVTVLFCDLTGSTSLGERLDSESMRALLERYFSAMRAAIEEHGGTIEKFVGDAVMAIFGTPVVHEDDALRAVRAGLQMRASLAELNEELESRWGARLETRTGINTGEVVAAVDSRGPTLATGDAVNVAARLEQSAVPGEILVGSETYRLVRGEVSCEPVAPLELKGKSEPVPAFRLLAIAPAADPLVAPHDSALVGRDRELAALTDAFERALAGPGLEMIGVVGAAGVGKSRLKRELLRRVAERATVLEGACLPYGRGITFWPVAEVVRQAAGIQEQDSPELAREKLTALVAGAEDAAMVANRMATLIGLVEGAAAAEEMAWALRRTLERIAGDGPLVVLLEDLHWAEAALVELIDATAKQSHGAPILFVWLARPEMDEAGRTLLTEGPRRGATRLEALGGDDTERFVANLLGEAPLEGPIFARIAENAQGNPLFVEEYMRMLLDDGWLESVAGAWRATVDLADIPLPATIGALLGARLDRLPGEERDLVERAAVIGQEFWRAAIEELADEPARSALDRYLESLVVRDLFERAETRLDADEAFRFRHILIRDSAYRGTLKALRSELHERFALWLKERSGARLAEYEEFVGYHLEQAHRLRTELGPEDDRARAIARAAAQALAAAGRRALARSDVAAAVNLLDRSVSLLGEPESAEGREALTAEDTERLEISLSLCDALIETGDVERAGIALGRVAAETEGEAQARLGARAQVMSSFLDLHRGALDPGDEEIFATVRGSVETLTAAADDAGSSQALRLLADLHMGSSHYGLAVGELEGALSHARKAGDEREVSQILTLLAATLFWGPTPARQAIDRCHDILDQAGESRVVESKTKLILGGLHGMTGEFEISRRLYGEGVVALDELGLKVSSATSRQISGMIELLAGRPRVAVDELRKGYEELKRMGQGGFLPAAAAFLARAELELDPAADVEELIADVRLAPADDGLAWADHELLRARLLARDGRYAEAVGAAREGVARYEGTDELKTRGDALFDASRVFLAAGEPEATAGLRAAVDLYRAKEVTPAVAMAEQVLRDVEGVA